jgi:hypothetical protein
LPFWVIAFCIVPPKTPGKFNIFCYGRKATVDTFHFKILILIILQVMFFLGDWPKSIVVKYKCNQKIKIKHKLKLICYF